MNILIVNDDGIGSSNLLPLKKTLEKYGRVYICVPDGERSGNSHSTKKYEVVTENFKKSDKGEDIYVHTGTACDSVKFFLKFVRRDVDMVVSGINQGFNLGADIVYSGTVGAALEANMHKIKSVALSARKNGSHYWAGLSELFEFLFNKLDWHNAMCLNVNFPDGYPPYNYKFVPIAQERNPSSGENDFNFCRNKSFLTISPVSLNMTDFESLRGLSDQYSGSLIKV